MVLRKPKINNNNPNRMHHWPCISLDILPLSLFINTAVWCLHLKIIHPLLVSHQWTSESSLIIELFTRETMPVSGTINVCPILMQAYMQSVINNGRVQRQYHTYWQTSLGITRSQLAIWYSFYVIVKQWTLCKISMIMKLMFLWQSVYGKLFFDKCSKAWTINTS